MNLYFNSIMPVKLRNAIINSQSMPYTYKDITLSASDMIVIMGICHNKDISSSELAELLYCTRSYISQVVSRLEKKELIYRKQLSDRKRFYGLYPTEKGLELNNNFMDYITQNNKFIIDDVMAQCSEEDIEIFLKVGNILGDSMLNRIKEISK